MRRLVFFIVMLLLYPAFAFSASTYFSDGAGFESPWNPTDNASNWDSFFGTPSRETTIVKVGSVSMKATSENQYMEKNTATQTEIWADFWFYCDTLSDKITFASFYEASWSGVLSFQITWDGNAVLSDGTNTWDSGLNPSTGTWYHVFIHVTWGTDGSETVQLRVNMSDSRDSWDVDDTSATIMNMDDCSWIDFGTIANDQPDTVYVDAFRSWYGPDEPAEWQTLK